MTGIIALGRIPVQLTPNVEDTIIAVTTTWEGASPQEIEQEIVDPQEEKLQGIANLKEITSQSIQGLGRVRLEFQVGTPKEEALREVSDKLREVPSYPDNVDEPVVEASDPDSQDYITWIIFSSEDSSFDVRTFQDFVEDRVEPVLERVEGVSEVNVLGGREREVQIRFDPVRLAQHGLTLAQFVRAIQRTNLNVSAGALEDSKFNVRVRTLGQYSGVEEVESTVLRQGPEGPVVLADVATVVETYKEVTNFVRSKGREVIAINAQKEVGANVIEVMDGIRGALAQLNQPDGVLAAQTAKLQLKHPLVLEQVYDQTIYIDDALALVQNNIWLGGSLATLVLILFLRSLRAAGVIALAIPISVMGAIVVMVALGRSVNVISLAGMAFAVGMVVDNAIVVLENIYRHLETGRDPYRAALDGAREVWGAVLAATLTTIVVFVPILLIEDEAGQLFRDIALAICAAVGLSLIVSVCMIPSAAARLLKPHREQGWFAKAIGNVGAPFRGVPDKFSKLVHALSGSTLARLGVVALLTTISIIGTIWLRPPADYLPQGNRNLVFGVMIPPSGYNISQQEVLAERVESTMRPFYEAGSHALGSAEYDNAASELPEVPTFDMAKRAPGPPVVPPPLANYFFVSIEERIFHGGICTEPSRVADLAPLFGHATRGEMAPGVLAFAFQLPLFRVGGATGSAVKVNFSGAELEDVTTAAESFFFTLMGKFGPTATQPSPSNFNVPGPELQVLPRLLQLGKVGLTAEDVGLAVQAASDGAIVGDYRIGGQTIDLKIVSSSPIGQRITTIPDLPMATATGDVVSLQTVADLRRIATAPQINRVGRQRAITLEFTADSGTPLESAVAQIEDLLTQHRAAGMIPPGVETSFTGSASKLESVQRAMLGDGTLLGTVSASLVLALIVTYLLLCVLFQSFLQPFVILFSVPLATLGGFGALYAVHLWSLGDRYMPVQNLDVLTMLGFVILIGVVVNNAILLVHQSLNFIRGGEDREPMPPRAAIAEAVRTRVRPIFMSMLTSVGGMAPLVFMPGSGSELYRGLGSVVLGGLLVSTVFTLILVPLLLSFVLDVQQALRKRRVGRVVAPATATIFVMALTLLASTGCRSPLAPPRESAEDVLARVLERHLRSAPEKIAPVAAQPSSFSDEFLSRLPELEAMAGAESLDEVAVDLGRDLSGEPARSLPIGLGDTVARAVKYNLSGRLARFDPLIADQEGIVAESEFDLVFYADARLAKDDEPRTVPVLNGVELGRSVAASEREALELGLRRRFATGATASIRALVDRFEDDTPGFDFDPDPAYGARVGVTVEQPLLRGRGSRVNEADIALQRNERERSLATLDQQLQFVCAETEKAYWDLRLAHRNLAAQQQLLDRGIEVRAVLAQRRQFDAREAEYAAAVATVEQRRGRVILARRVVKAASDRLKKILNDPELPIDGEAVLVPTDEFSEQPIALPVIDAIARALRQRPELQEALLEIDDASIREEVARNLAHPRLDLSAALSYASLEDDLGAAIRDLDTRSFVTFAFGLTYEIPVGNRGPQAAGLQAALQHQRALLALELVVDELVAEVKDALRGVQTSFELVASERAFRIAQTENLRVLVADEVRRPLTPEFLDLKFSRQEQLARAQLGELAALADYNRAIAELYRALGGGLRRRGIDVQPFSLDDLRVHGDADPDRR